MKRLLIVILITLLLTGCTSTRYVEVPVDRVKIEYRDRTLIDSLIKKDSVIIRERGDTVFLEKYKYLYKTNKIRDTISIKDTITIVNTVEVTKEVNKVYNWQVILMILGGVAIVLELYKLVIFVKKWI